MTLGPLLLSLWVATLATILVLIAGIPLSVWLSRHRGPWARLIDALVTAPLVIPPVVTGYYLLILFGPSGPIGRITDRLFGGTVVFHWTGAVLASAVVALPLLVRTARSALEGVPRGYLEAASTCGAGPTRVLWSVHFPLALPGIAAGATLAFARALGEFGATLLVAGNIPGKSQTLPLAIYDAVFAGDYGAANRMVIFVTVLALVLLFLADGLQRRATRGREADGAVARGTG